MKPSRAIRNFIFSQYFTDGIKITFGVLLPSLIFYQFHYINIGVTISLGAVCVSIVDNPGPVIHKRNAMLVCNVVIFLTALLTGIINNFPVFLGFEIVLLSFFFSMLSVYGNRSSAIGTAALLIMVLSIDHLSAFGIFEHALYILTGGLWYLILSLSVAQLKPYRQAQQELGECIEEIARYIRFKAEFYDIKTNIEKNYKQLINQQIIVHTHQDSVREILFKSRIVMKDTTDTGRHLILTFVDIIDLFDQSTSMFYDYEAIRTKFGGSGILFEYRFLILKIAEQLEDLSFTISSNLPASKMSDLQFELEKLKNQTDKLESDGLNNFVLKKILINIRNMVARTQKIYSYFNPETLAQHEIRRKSDLPKFVSHQEFGFKNLKENLNLESSIFRHSLRVAFAMLIGYLVSKLFPFGHHSYWILLTILVILKPGFTLTKQRNYQRLIGTILGGIGGALILYFINDQAFLFILLMIFMVASYSFQRLNYTISVVFMTPFILILFYFMGGGDGILIARERITDTFTGSAIALIANYYILPKWEFQQLKDSVKEVLVANYHYLNNVSDILTGKTWDLTAYKLSRKAVYVSSANIAGAFQRMLAEPKSKQRKAKDLHKFVVITHILSSYTATLISTLQPYGLLTGNKDYLKLVKQSLLSIKESINLIDKNDEFHSGEADLASPNLHAEIISDNDANLIREQLELVRTTTSDILKIAQSLANI
ncbi:MAG: FUSC family protein [Flavobacterium sp.]|nr:FUSC family protein [Pedobacter sp.]